MHRYFVDVLGEVDDSVADPEHLALACATATLQIRAGDLTPDLSERRALAGVGDDDEVPVLRVARRGRLLREIEALLEHLALHRAREIQALPDGAGRREQLVGCQIEGDVRILRLNDLPHPGDGAVRENRDAAAGGYGR